MYIGMHIHMYLLPTLPPSHQEQKELREISLESLVSITKSLVAVTAGICLLLFANSRHVCETKSLWFETMPARLHKCVSPKRRKQ
jgi:hypothetical protein